MDVVTDLGDELASWRDDEGADTGGLGLDVSKDAKHGKSKGGGLPGAGLGDADDVLSPHDDGNRSRLNWRGLAVASFFNCIEKWLREFEIGEGHVFKAVLRMNAWEKTAN